MSPVLPALFADDDAGVRAAVAAALLVAAVAQLLAGWVVVLDGVLIVPREREVPPAGDGRSPAS